jgi:hypothetical protein
MRQSEVEVQGDKDTKEEDFGMNSTGRTTTRAAGPSVPLDAQTQIGRRLASIYNEVLQQPVPDRFRILLDELEQKEGPLKKPKADDRSST